MRESEVSNMTRCLFAVQSLAIRALLVALYCVERAALAVQARREKVRVK